MATGQKVYEGNCASCHQKEGQGIPGMFPAIAGSDVVTGEIDRHISTVMHGVPDTPMMPFGSRLSDVDMAAVITYQRNAFGNDTGDTLQPSQMRSLRQGLRQSALELTDSNNLKGVN